MGNFSVEFTSDSIISRTNAINTNNKRRASQQPYITKVPNTKKLSAPPAELPNMETNILAQTVQKLQAEFLEMRQEIDIIKQLQQENADLKSRLEAALLEIEQLKQKNNKNTDQNNNNNTTTMDSQWADVTKQNLPPQQPQQKNKNQQQKKFQNQKKQQKNSTPTEGMLDWAYRGFTESTGPSGYQFIHFKISGRTTQRTVRKRLAVLGISNRRILAVQFPTKGVVALLVHNAYAEDIKALFAQKKIKPHDFDPLHEDVICDPQHIDKSTAEKKEMAATIYNARMVRLCSAIKPQHIGSAIIRYFNQHVTGSYHLPDNVVSEFFASLGEKPQQQNTQTDNTLSTQNLDFDFMTDDDELQAQQQSQ